MPQVAALERKRRARILREEGAKALGRFLASRVGGQAQIVVERAGRGRCEHYAPVAFEGAAKPGNVITVALTGIKDDVLIGRPVNRHGR